MKVEVKIPKITEYHFYFEEGDPIRSDCLWARIYLNHETYTMSAITDCGDYSYTWHVTPTESFLKLMTRLDKEYLLNKISDRSVFDWDESKREAIEHAVLNDFPDGIVEQVREIDFCDCPTEESFVRYIHELTNTYFEMIPVIKRFPHGAVTFVEIFCEYLQPLLRESLKVTNSRVDYHIPKPGKYTLTVGIRGGPNTVLDITNATIDTCKKHESRGGPNWTPVTGDGGK